MQNEDGPYYSPPHSAGGHTWHHADSILIEAIKKGGARFEGMNIGGISLMPAFGRTLSDEEIGVVLTFVKVCSVGEATAHRGFLAVNESYPFCQM